ncbi:SMODS domain-containing nucleotidyltransferase [Cellvibrio sp.]|uniref:SMODS domain-containing nucleotidyltransferase n=1 Tax=Cellvibrio sp. TaxID=1965322 RepID=UPI0039647F3C
MKLVSEFTDFLTNTVNLNKTRFDLLESSIEAVKSVITDLDWEPSVLGFAAQGSWAHQTIIKPLPDKPFDADLLVFVSPVTGWEAKDYINTLYDVFNSHATYKDKVRRCSHCITIDYANERNIDVAPCLERGIAFFAYYQVCNRNTNQFEDSAPQKYTDWLAERNTIAGNNTFRKTTRLVKYLRDIKTTFTCPSFLLTTLLGMQVTEADRGTTTFTDVPTALKVLMGRLDDWLTLRPVLPEVRNPVLNSEIQSNAWDEAKYQNFRSKINTYRTWIDDAYNEADREESIGKWQRVFGDEFAAKAVVTKAASVSTEALALVSHVPAARGAKDLVALVQQIGLQALPAGFNKLPHMHRPTWRVARETPVNVLVKADLYASREGMHIQRFNSLDIASPDTWLRFQTINGVGMPMPNTYRVKWRVTNTDVTAAAKGQLRGEFYGSHEHGTRWEKLEFRGVHIVEAFLIKNDQLIGQSPPFYVTIV